MEEQQLGFDQFQKSSKREFFSREQLIHENEVLELSLAHTLKKLKELQNQNLSDEQLKFILQEELSEARKALFGASSERLSTENNLEKPKVKTPIFRPKLPSERYPKVPVREVVVGFDTAPNCEACGEEMSDSGMKESSEQLTVIPKRFEIIRTLRPKYRCTCGGCVKTPILPPRMVPGSAYSDEMILDVVLSKYCDLIPIQRYVAMAKRGGLTDLPPQSLIELTHHCAWFLEPVYSRLKNEILEAKVLHADETPHRMLEGSDSKSWYLWGFSTPSTCYLDIQNTRSGDVASELLKEAKLEVLVSDVFSGYSKAIKDLNREKPEQEKIKNAFCNAHARRYFFNCYPAYKEADFYLEKYKKIYAIEAQKKPPDQESRGRIKTLLNEIKEQAEIDLPYFPSGTKMEKALSYFLKNFEGLILFAKDPRIPIDNNPQERLLRNHVVGRKTWYGTHSERGAKTAAVLFSLVETCKLIGVNPRQYFQQITKDLLQGNSPYTPQEFKSAQTKE